MRNAPLGRAARWLEPVVGPNVRSHAMAVRDGMAAERWVQWTHARLGGGILLSRGLAYLIDGALFLPVVALLLFGVRLLPDGVERFATPTLPIGPVVYLVLLHRLGGQTAGKALTGLRVVDAGTGSPISWRQSIVRAATEAAIPAAVVAGALLVEAESPFAVLSIVALVSSFIVRNLWAVFDCGAALFERGQCTLHDRAAGTMVVRVDRTSP